MRGEGGDDSVSAGKEEPERRRRPTSSTAGPASTPSRPSASDYSRGTDRRRVGHQRRRRQRRRAGRGRQRDLGREALRRRRRRRRWGAPNGRDDIFVDADSSTIRGLGGDDKLVAYDGNDTIEGGDGNDFLEGGFGNDVLDGGAGVDQFRGDRIESNVIAVGADQIRARDGNAEQIDCGIGPDTAQVDASDVVVGCESVDRAGGRPAGRDRRSAQPAAAEGAQQAVDQADRLEGARGPGRLPRRLHRDAPSCGSTRRRRASCGSGARASSRGARRRCATPATRG